MINVIQTLKNLNKEFPRYQLETLLKIVECIQDDPIINYPTTWEDWRVEPWKNYTVTCGEDPSRFIYNTTTKNHTPDKTSYKQTITSEGEQATDEDMHFSNFVKDLNDISEALKASRITCG